MAITFSDAIKTMWQFITGRNNKTEDNQVDELLHCKRCNKPMTIETQSHTDFVSVIIYICPNCGLLLEQQIDNENGCINKEIFLYEPYKDNHHSHLEIFNNLSFNNFDLNKLWSIAGVLCYPVLIRSEFHTEPTLIFVKCKDNIRNGDVDGFIINEHRMICNLHIMRNQEISYFCNPYFLNLPHTNYSFFGYPTEINDQLEYIDKVRYMHKIRNKNNIRVHEIIILEDFPLQTFGVEIYVKVLDYKEIEESLKDICRHIHLDDLIKGSESREVDEGYSIQSVRIHQINLFAYSTNNIKKEIRDQFIIDVNKLLQYIS